jgi:hypothetical protein
MTPKAQKPQKTTTIEISMETYEIIHSAKMQIEKILHKKNVSIDKVLKIAFAMKSLDAQLSELMLEQ